MIHYKEIAYVIIEVKGPKTKSRQAKDPGHNVAVLVLVQVQHPA